MTSDPSPDPLPIPTAPFSTAPLVYPSSMLISLTTAPIVLGLVLGRSLAATVEQIGLASEEIFRGDRLPVLTVSEPSEPVAPADTTL